MAKNDPESQLLRGALIPSFAVGVVAIALALFSYFAKLLLLTGFLIALTRLTSRDTIDRASFGITAIALTFAWLGGEIASYLKLRLHLPLPPKPGER
jgi:hypothetical protein